MRIVYMPSVLQRVREAKEGSDKCGTIIEKIVLTADEGKMLDRELRNWPTCPLSDPSREGKVYGVRIEVES